MSPESLPLVASHQFNEPSAIVGWVFAGIVATLVFLLASSVEEKRAVQISAAGWVVGILAFVVI